MAPPCGGSLWRRGSRSWKILPDDLFPRLGLLTHTPDVFPGVPTDVALTLAGHTHGGQVNLPFLGRLIVPSIYGERFAYGLIEETGRRLYVTSGIGTAIIPVRFRTPPEIVVTILDGT